MANRDSRMVLLCGVIASGALARAVGRPLRSTIPGLKFDANAGPRTP